MIQLNPIEESVQKTLLEKIKMSGKQGKAVTEPLSGEKSDYLSARTVWARMIALSTSTNNPRTPIVISAGEESVEPIESTTDPITGGTAQFSPIKGRIRGTFDEVYDRTNLHRPIAGLKSISTGIEGAYKAVRKADIRWICWDFDTLERLTPFFLSPGVSVALEFGWMWPGHIPQEFIYDNWAEMDARKIGALSDVIRKQGQGHQDMVYGIVKNFSWTGRDDGGFDCSTQIISPSMNVFSTPLGDSEKAPTFEISEDLKNQIRGKRDFWSKRETEHGEVFSDDNIQSQLKDQGLVGDEDNSYIENVPPRLLFDNFKQLLLDLRYGDQMESYIDTIICERTNRVEPYIGPYVSYGWFEDNILNTCVGKVVDGDKLSYSIRSVDFVSEDKEEKWYRSTTISNDTTSLITMDAEKVIIPGQFPYSTNFEKELNRMEGEDENKNRKDKDYEFETYWKRKIWKKIEEKVRELPAFAVKATGEEKDDDTFESFSERGKDLLKATKGEDKDGDFKYGKEKGYLRNLLIHADLISESMKTSNTFEGGLKNLLANISDACGGIWDFELATSEDGSTVKVIEKGSPEKPVRALLDNQSMNLETGNVKDKYNNKGLMIFPTWQTNSIVFNQNMVTKLPSQMATVAMYGRNLSAKEASNEEMSGDKAARALGKLFNSKLNNVEDVINKNIERILGNTEINKFGLNELAGDQGRIKEINVSAEKGIVIDAAEIIKQYTEKQIMDILNDGIDYDKEKDPTVEGTRDKESTALDYTFLYDRNGKIRKHYKDALLHFLHQSPGSIKQTEDILTPIEFEVTIDGTGGIFPGEAFSSTYIPKRYRDATVFQIMDINHRVDGSGWKTTLRGLMRIDYGLGEKKPMSEMLEEIYADKMGDSKAPPYLSFAEYLTASVGKISKYKITPEKQKEIDASEQSDQPEPSPGLNKNNRPMGGGGRNV